MTQIPNPTLKKSVLCNTTTINCASQILWLNAASISRISGLIPLRICSRVPRPPTKISGHAQGSQNLSKLCILFRRRGLWRLLSLKAAHNSTQNLPADNLGYTQSQSNQMRHRRSQERGQRMWSVHGTLKILNTTCIDRRKPTL